MTLEELTEYFEYLDDLRQSGVTNMYGAGAYLEEEFALSRKQAHLVLKQWMESFDAELPASSRAEILTTDLKAN